MTTAGIIAEYNPFHKGHRYQYEQIGKQTGADRIVCVMSGNFVQRGSAALLDKYTRTRMALLEGADLVLELPTVYATASAETFASGGVSVLTNTGIVDLLCFGSEHSDPEKLLQVSSILYEESPAYKEALADALRSGFSFPTAREQAVKIVSPLPEDEITEILRGSNNILSLEYLKAIKELSSPLTPVPLTRIGGAYNSTEIDHRSFSSATAIRTLLLEDNPSHELLALALTEDSFSILMEEKKKQNLVFDHMLDQFLGYALLSEFSSNHDNHIGDCPEDLYCRMKNLLHEYHGFDSFCDLLKTKTMTRASIKRALIHLLLGITDRDLIKARSNAASYIRVLGFKRSSAALIGEMKARASVPVIMNPASDVSALSEDGLAMFRTDCFASNLYHQARAMAGGEALKNDFSHPLVIM